MLRSGSYFVLFLLFSGMFLANVQDPARYKDQVEQLSSKENQFESDKKLVVFAGSSSIRMWIDVQDHFPDYNVVDNGVGGSQYSDLLYYYDKLILSRRTDILFINEGDNDIAKH